MSVYKFWTKKMAAKQPKRPARIDKAMKELRSYARSEMAKTEIVQFRIDQADFERLVEAASVRKIPMGALVRGWVLSHLEQETDHRTKTASKGQMSVAEQTTSMWPDSSRQRSSKIKQDEFVKLRRELSMLKKRLDKIEGY